MVQTWKEEAKTVTSWEEIKDQAYKGLIDGIVRVGQETVGRRKVSNGSKMRRRKKVAVIRGNKAGRKWKSLSRNGTEGVYQAWEEYKYRKEIVVRWRKKQQRRKNRKCVINNCNGKAEG